MDTPEPSQRAEDPPKNPLNPETRAQAAAGEIGRPPPAAGAAEDAPRPLSPMSWLNRYVRQRWRGRFLVFAEELCPEGGRGAAEAPGTGAAEADEARGGGGGGEAAPAPEALSQAQPAVKESAFRLDSPQDDEVDVEPRFRAHITGVECCCELADGRERKVACGETFTALGVTRRRAEQAAAALVRDWFVARGLWDPATVEGPPPPNFSLARVGNRHRVQSRLRYETNPLVYMDISLGDDAGVHRVVLELFQHTEPQGAACFLGMLHGPPAEQQAPEPRLQGGGAGHAPPLDPPPGAGDAAALRGAVFDCVLPGLLVAVGGAPEGTLEIAVDPQTRAIARARKEVQEEQERGEAGEAAGSEHGGDGSRGRGRGGGVRGRGRGGRGWGRGWGGRGRGRGGPAEGGEGKGGAEEGDGAPGPPPRNRYEQRFDRPFLVAVPRDLALGPALAGGIPDSSGGTASGSPAAAGAAESGRPADGSQKGSAGDGALPASAPPPAGAPAPPPPAPATGPSFFISLGPSRELQECHLAVGHVLAGFGALREAAQAAQDAKALREAAEARACQPWRGGGACPAVAAAAGPPPCRIAACRRLLEGAAPPPVEPLMLGPWPAWPEDLAPPARPDLELEARARLDMALGIKAAGNEAHAAGDMRRAVAHYRQGIRYLELISFRSDLMGAPSLTISYDTSLPMWATELALRLNLSGALTALGRGAEAAEVLRELRHKVPSNAKMWYRLGQALAAQGPSRLPEALEAFSKAAALVPNDTAVRTALQEVRGRISRGQAATRGRVGRGLSRAFGDGLLYGSGEEAWEEGAEEGGAEAQQDEARGAAAPAGPDGEGEGGGGSAAVAGSGGGKVRCGRREQLPCVGEELAAELIGRHLGLHTLHGRMPPPDPAVQMMAAWFKPRA